MTTRPPTIRTKRAAFTMVEILVVVSIVVLMMAVAIPSINQLFTSGADAQAYNIIAAQLAAARALAIQKQTYAGVHVQLADSSTPETRKYVNTCFAAVVWDDPNTPNDSNFRLAPGFFPRRLPGNMLFAKLAPPYADYTPGQLIDPNIPFVTTFTIAFSPNGQLARAYMVVVDPDPNNTLFNYVAGEKQYLWSSALANVDPNSVGALLMFSGEKFFSMLPTDRANFLRLNGQVVGVNWYTGAVLGR